MTTHKGNGGVVKVATNAVGELTSWSITETQGTTEDTSLGDIARTYLPDGLQAWSGSMVGHYDPSDTTGQAALVAGATLAGEFFSDGTGSGKKKFAGSLIVTSVQIGEVSNGVVVPWTAQFQGSGALARSAVP